MSGVVYSTADSARLSRVVGDLIRHRGLLRDFVWKDLRARYRDALIGFAWAVLQPLMLTAILTFIFSYFLSSRAGQSGVTGPFAAFVLCGLVPWQLTSSGLVSAMNSLRDNENLIKKVRFPRELLPLSAVANALVTFCIGFVLLLVVCSVLGVHLGGNILWVPVVLSVHIALVAGLGLLLACPSVYYRDVAYLIEVGVTFWFYATPVFYPPSIIERQATAHPWLYALYHANPMVNLLGAYRDAILNNTAPTLASLVWPLAVALACVGLGLLVFRRSSPCIADYL